MRRITSCLPSRGRRFADGRSWAAETAIGESNVHMLTADFRSRWRPAMNSRLGLGPCSLLLLLALSAAGTGCSIKKIAVNKLGDSLASGGDTFASDDDPDLVGEALPFSLKLMESLLAESPQHRGLLLAASSGFTQYAFVYVQVPAEETEDQDLAKADALRIR